jgi:hypothetical protein
MRITLFPVSFALDDGHPRFVTLADAAGVAMTKPARGDLDELARSMLRDTLDALATTGSEKSWRDSHQDLMALSGRFLGLAGADHSGDDVSLIYTTSLPIPFAEEALDISAGSVFSWRTISQSQGRRTPGAKPEFRTGPEAVVLDYWRQALEETDMALDFLPPYFSLLQLRGLYDAVWGYEQDPSGFKRWAIDRTAAFHGLVDEVKDPSSIGDEFLSSLSRRLPRDQAAKAGAAVAQPHALPADLRLPIVMAAATTANRIHPRRGPEPKWFKKSSAWRPGPTWIEHLYPPRPSWTRWEVDRG